MKKTNIKLNEEQIYKGFELLDIKQIYEDLYIKNDFLDSLGNYIFVTEKKNETNNSFSCGNVIFYDKTI
ncbi:MAG: hypothetical protein LBM99_03655 [Bacillales bacterium]|jgi:hypothetical protein|nr:hypothetical protein [Bacillales bacterium]